MRFGYISPYLEFRPAEQAGKSEGLCGTNHAQFGADHVSVAEREKTLCGNGSARGVTDPISRRSSGNGGAEGALADYFGVSLDAS